MFLIVSQGLTNVSKYFQKVYIYLQMILMCLQNVNK